METDAMDAGAPDSLSLSKPAHVAHVFSEILGLCCFSLFFDQAIVDQQVLINGGSDDCFAELGTLPHPPAASRHL
ncbi:hypothetical protein GUJ93_ZPchr0002g26767 [Zizania palustris]|uniref:Uncharacterized protein n=1 Tax=Zizania palustris TaxID=103762 RepID=A0A8J5S9G6_ZIZPA|nr:hypothetical protein GUJ93_ZPchr0002g26767 [Zizania palustris]